MTHAILSGQAQLACDIEGTGPTVVLLHAGVADRRSYAAVIPAFARLYRVVAYDRRGYGDTTYKPEEYAHVDDLRAILDALGVERAVLVGNSQGGRISIDFALQYPERVTSMVLVAPAVSGEPDPDHASLSAALITLDEAIEAADAAGDNERVNRLEAHLWLDGPRSNEGRVDGDARALFLDMNGRALAAPSPGTERPPASAYERLGELSMPVHVILGDLDLQVTNERGRHLAASVKRGSVTVMPNVAHVPQLEQPQRFAEIVMRFLGDNGL